MIAAVPAAYRSSTAKRGNPPRLAATGRARRVVQVLRILPFCLPYCAPPGPAKALVPTPGPRLIDKAVDPELDELA